MATRPHRSPAREIFHDTCPCGRPHDLWLSKGAVCEQTVLIDGSRQLDPLPITKWERRPNKEGTYRWYHLLRLPCGNAHRVRVDNTAQDVKSGFNRAEYLRQHPPETDGYKALYPRRPDGENVNSALDATLWNRRRIAYGAERQTLTMLGFAIGHNALCRWFAEATQEIPRAA